MERTREKQDLLSVITDHFGVKKPLNRFIETLMEVIVDPFPRRRFRLLRDLIDEGIVYLYQGGKLLSLLLHLLRFVIFQI